MASPELLVGLVYDLRDDHAGLGLSEEELAEFDSPVTIDALQQAIVSHGHRVERVGNHRALVRSLDAGQRWDLVFNIAEGRFGIGREAQVPALLDAFEIPYTFSDPLVCAVTLHKAVAKRILRDCRVPTPAFFLVERPEDIARVRLGYPLFAKPVAEGTSKGIDERSRVDDARELREVCERLLERFAQPVLVEEFVPGRELTVGVVGTGERARAVAALEVLPNDTTRGGIYSFVNKEEWRQRMVYRLADDEMGRECCRLALEAWRAIGARDAGRVDLRCDAVGRPLVLEINPLPGLNPGHSDLPILWGLSGGTYEGLVGAILDSAMERLRGVVPVTCGS